jgi:hypothetical protein
MDRVTTTDSVIFKVSDLAQSRTELLEAARHGRARVRDTDGTGLVMLREQELVLLEQLTTWSRALSRLEKLLKLGEPPTVRELGPELAWLRAFDPDDLQEFAEELDDALVAAQADGDAAPIENAVSAWRLTARQLEDPLRRSILLGTHVETDYLDISRPEGLSPQRPGPEDD